MGRKRKGASRPASRGPLSRGDRRRIVHRARKLNREGPWLLHRHGSTLSDGTLWHIADRCRELRAELKKLRSERDITALLKASDAVDTELTKHLGAKRKGSGRQNAEAITAALVVALFIRLFIFEAYRIPSGSMIPTLLVGDFIFVSKYTYGVQLPFTDVTFFDWREPARGEVVIFEHPVPSENDEILIKRVMATAGDRVRMTDNVWYVNGEPLGEPKVLARMVPCRLSPGEQCLWTDRSAAYGVDPSVAEGCPCTLMAEQSDMHEWVSQHIHPDALCECTLPEGEAAGLARAQHINEGYWPAPPPFFSRGDAYQAWWPSEHEDKALQVGPEGLPEAEIPEGYVMVMGDNRDNSADGRYWGLVPLNKIRGKASFIWLRWPVWDEPSRMFHLVH